MGRTKKQKPDCGFLTAVESDVRQAMDLPACLLSVCRCCCRNTLPQPLNTSLARSLSKVNKTEKGQKKGRTQREREKKALEQVRRLSLRPSVRPSINAGIMRRCRNMLPSVVVFAATALSSLPWRALGEWNDCSISSEDYWAEASDDFLPRIMQGEWKRRYACPAEEGAESSASYKFVSPCMERFYSRAEIKSCLKGRRLIFLGDSLASQQGDSIVAMMGWNVSFTPKDAEGRRKHVNLPDGTQVRGPAACYRTYSNGTRLPTNRCFDIYETDFLVDGAAGAGEEGGSPTVEEEAPEFTSISVHVRDFSKPRGPNWLEKVVADFNGTTASDIVIVNFGAHYHEDGDKEFRTDMSELLDDMGKLADTAAMVVWRECSPLHFPATNGSYEAFDALSPEKKKGVCCTGTPPEVSARNVWVEKYMKDTVLSEKVKLLRIYRMSSFRGTAHRKCNVGEPTSPSQYDQHVFAEGSQCAHVPVFDCLHWSEPGVVEEWNRLMLNHICPA